MIILDQYGQVDLYSLMLTGTFLRSFVRSFVRSCEERSTTTDDVSGDVGVGGDEDDISHVHTTRTQRKRERESVCVNERGVIWFIKGERGTYEIHPIDPQNGFQYPLWNVFFVRARALSRMFFAIVTNRSHILMRFDILCVSTT